MWLEMRKSWDIGIALILVIVEGTLRTKTRMGRE